MTETDEHGNEMIAVPIGYLQHLEMLWDAAWEVYNAHYDNTPVPDDQWERLSTVLETLSDHDEEDRWETARLDRRLDACIDREMRRDDAIADILWQLDALHQQTIRMLASTLDDARATLEGVK